MSISQSVRKALEASSWVRRMFELGLEMKKQFGDDQVFDLSLGNPVLEPPKEFHQELRRLAEAPIPGMHRYMPNAGIKETRMAVASRLARETGLSFTENEIIMASGAGGALNVIFKTILNPGEEVLVPAPFFWEYIAYAGNHGGSVRPIPTGKDFQLDLGVIEEEVTSATRAIIINSPNNPTGVVYSPEMLKSLGALLSKLSEKLNTLIYLISDEPYARIIFDGLEYPYVYPFYSPTIVATSFSKDLSLAGERIGYIAVHPDFNGKLELIEGLTYSTRVLGFVNAPAMMQRAVQASIDLNVDVGWYQTQRDRLCRSLEDMGYQFVHPQGAFYLFPKAPIADDVAFAQELISHRVLVTPGVGFGGPGHFRISYSVEERVLEGALYGLSLAARAHGLPG